MKQPLVVIRWQQLRQEPEILVLHNMAHYAFLDDNNIVTEVIVGVDETQLIEGKDPEIWYGQFRGQTCKRTSYNTKGGKHYSHETGKWSKERQFRGNYAGVGYRYDDDLDAFIPPKPFDSWILNEETYSWDAPIPDPDDGNDYKWNEPEQKWDLIEADQTA